MRVTPPRFWQHPATLSTHVAQAPTVVDQIGSTGDTGVALSPLPGPVLATPRPMNPWQALPTWAKWTAAVTVSSLAAAVVIGGTVGLRGAARPATAQPTPVPAARAQCAFAAGELAAATLGGAFVQGLKSHLETIVLVTQENRAFDQYFGGLPAIGRTDADVAASGATNPGQHGPVGRHRAQTYTLACPNHDWNAVHRVVNGGRMDGFVRDNESPHDDAEYVMAYYTAQDLPFYYALANNFSISDRYFSAVLAGTLPNRQYLYAGTSVGQAFNDHGAFPSNQTTVFDALTAAQVPWKIYTESGPKYVLDNTFPNSFAHKFAAHIFSLADYFADAAAGTLPAFCIVEPSHAANQADEHPPASAKLGQDAVQRIFTAFANSANWGKGAFILNYDEAGGYFDHVPPPPACAPDNHPAYLRPSDVPGNFSEYGVRVPLILASPHAKKRFVSHVTNDHTSVLRLVEARFDLPALTARDANAHALADLFDFGNP